MKYNILSFVVYVVTIVHNCIKRKRTTGKYVTQVVGMQESECVFDHVRIIHRLRPLILQRNLDSRGSEKRETNITIAGVRRVSRVAEPGRGQLGWILAEPEGPKWRWVDSTPSVVCHCIPTSNE